MIGFDGRLQWRQHELFKLRAKLPRRKKDTVCNELGVLPRNRRDIVAPPKFAIRSNLVRRTRIEQASSRDAQFPIGLDQRCSRFPAHPRDNRR
jgi:hypothetical protein